MTNIPADKIIQSSTCDTCGKTYTLDHLSYNNATGKIICKICNADAAANAEIEALTKEFPWFPFIDDCSDKLKSKKVKDKLNDPSQYIVVDNDNDNLLTFASFELFEKWLTKTNKPNVELIDLENLFVFHNKKQVAFKYYSFDVIDINDRIIYMNKHNVNTNTEM